MSAELRGSVGGDSAGACPGGPNRSAGGAGSGNSNPTLFRRNRQHKRQYSMPGITTYVRCARHFLFGSSYFVVLRYIICSR